MLKGVVADINERGAMIDGDWYKYTKQEWRESPWHSPTIGDTVEVKLEATSSGRSSWNRQPPRPTARRREPGSFHPTAYPPVTWRSSWPLKGSRSTDLPT